MTTSFNQAAAGRLPWDGYFLELAGTVGTRAACTRRQVGCVVVKDRRLVATGYNGAPSGHPHCSEGACPRGASAPGRVVPLSSYDDPYSAGFCVAVHAEANALLQAGREAQGATVYITDRPCPGCLKLLIAAGVAAAVWPLSRLELQKADVWDDWKRTDPDRARCPCCGASVHAADYDKHLRGSRRGSRAICTPCEAVARTESN